MENKTCQITVHINAARDDVWEILSSPAEMASLIGTEIKTKFKYFGDIVNGQLGALDRVFEVRLKPYDIEIYDDNIRVGFRVTHNPDYTCEVMAVAICKDETDATNAEQILPEIIRRIKVTSEPYKPEPEPIEPLETGEDSTYKPIKYKAAPTVEIKPEKPIIVEQLEQEQTRFQKVIMPIAASVSTIAFLVGVFFVFSMYFPSSEAALDVEGVSEYVSFENMGTIKLGDTRQTVEALFNTSGEVTDNGTVYKSEQLLPTGLSSYQTAINYDAGGIVNRIEYINTVNSSAIEALAIQPADILPEMSIFDISTAMGSPISLYRNYYDLNGNEIVEAHFGFSDPFATFSDSFVGEYAVYINRTTGEIKREQLEEYEGYDPLLISTLEGHPASNQYSSYDDFIKDKFITEKAMFLSNDYSKGDIEAVFDATLDIYSTVGNNLLYNVNSAAGNMIANNFRDAGNYKLTVILDENGMFNLGSFTNVKLMSVENALSGTMFRRITRDMSYNEIAYMVPILPTSVIFDANSITYCYGKYLNRSEVDQQYEVIVKYDKKTMIAQNVYINAELQDGGTSGMAVVPQPEPTGEPLGEMPPSAGEQVEAMEQAQQEAEAEQNETQDGEAQGTETQDTDTENTETQDGETQNTETQDAG